MYNQQEAEARRKSDADTRRRRLEECRQHQQPLLNLVGARPEQFTIKPAFWTTNAARVVGFYPEELARGYDFYMELIGPKPDLLSTEEGRPLFFWKWNPYYKEEYPISDKGTYQIPFDELKIVPRPEIAKKQEAEQFANEVVSKSLQSAAKPKAKLSTASVAEPAVSEDVNPLDQPFSKLSVINAAAIMWRLPIATDPEINQFIKEYK